MRWTSILALAAALTLAAAGAATTAAADPTFQRPPPAKGFSYPECYCTNRGVKVEMGRLTCIRVGGSEFTARCGMSLNNPTWRKVRDGCEDGLSRTAPGSEFLEQG